MGGDRISSTGTGPVIRPKTPTDAARPPLVAGPGTTPGLTADQLRAQDPTVGDYVEQQIRQAGQALKQDAQLTAIMVSPLGPVAMVVEARHMSLARERIAKLPMDPQGKWKTEAAAILAQENKAARAEILALPAKAGQAVVDGATAVGEGAVAAAVVTGQGVKYAADKATEGVNYAVDKSVEGYHYAVDKATEGAVVVAETVDQGIDAASTAAQKAWGGVTGLAAQVWAWAQDAIPKAFHALFQETQVAAIALNPLGAVPSAMIAGKHMNRAYDRIMKLPMDPDGKWQDAAAQILAEEQNAARQEVLQLPGKAGQAIQSGVQTARQGVGGALQNAGKAIAGDDQP